MFPCVKTSFLPLVFGWTLPVQAGYVKPKMQQASLAVASTVESIKHDINPITGRMIGAGATALALHHLVFRKGEWHLQAPNIFIAYLLSYPAVFVLELLIGAKSLPSSAFNTILTLTCFTLVIFASIGAYRVFFHRLSSFPGPKGARISKLWHSAQCLGGRNHIILEKLRKEYGDFVRTGPSEITVFNPEVLIKLDSPGSKTQKSPWYDFPMPDMGITTIRDRALHDQRRKVWSQAFSTKAMPIYERQVVEHAEKLEQLIHTSAKEMRPVPFKSLAYWFSFDIMGMFALSESFDMLHGEKWHYAVSNLARAMSIVGPISPVPWLSQIGFRFLRGYWVVKDWHSMTGWCKERMEHAIKANNAATDVASYLIADSMKKGSIEKDRNLLAGDAISAVIAGSDTVAPTIVFLFYELARNPSQAEKLFQELKDINFEEHKALETLSHLNAIINETLRLHPAIPTAGYRDTPPEGITIDGCYIPGNTTIVAPRYSIFRSESCFERPDDFIPERWYSKPGLVKDSQPFLPFAQGRYGCLGKNIALWELKIVTALLVSKYYIRFPVGNNGCAVERDMKDSFTAAPGELDLVFTHRP